MLSNRTWDKREYWVSAFGSVDGGGLANILNFQTSGFLFIEEERRDKERGGRENGWMKTNIQVENTHQIMFLLSILSILNQKSTST